VTETRARACWLRPDDSPFRAIAKLAVLTRMPQMRQGEIRLPQTESRWVTTSRDEEIRVLLETARKKLKESAPMNRRTFLSALSGPRSVRRVGVRVAARRLSGRPVALAVIVVAAALMAHDRFLT
jgi:hypothetical protein